MGEPGGELTQGGHLPLLTQPGLGLAHAAGEGGDEDLTYLRPLPRHLLGVARSYIRVMDSRGEQGQDFCPVREYINVLQEKWVLHIVRVLLAGPRGFNELGREVGGCNPKTLSRRLDVLEELGILKKTVLSVMPPKTEYELSRAGAELEEVISAIDRWSRRHTGSLPAKDRDRD